MKSQQDKIVSRSAAASRVIVNHGNKFQCGNMGTSQSTILSAAGSLDTLRPIRNHTNAKANSGKSSETSVVETDQTHNSPVTSAQDKVEVSIVSHENTPNRRLSIMEFARRMSSVKRHDVMLRHHTRHNSVKGNPSSTDKENFELRYNNFMQCQLELDLEEKMEEQGEEEEKEEEDVKNNRF